MSDKGKEARYGKKNHLSDGRTTHECHRIFRNRRCTGNIENRWYRMVFMTMRKICGIAVSHWRMVSGRHWLFRKMSACMEVPFGKPCVPLQMTRNGSGNMWHFGKR